MSVPTITLSGSATTGIMPHKIPATLMAQLPSTVRLGRRRSRHRRQTLRLENYIKNIGSIPIPDMVDWYSKAAASIAHMYLNDTYGDCVMASSFHRLGIWSANDPDSGPIVIATDNEVYDQYQSICGPGDNGCYIPDVLDVGVSKGWKAGGKYYKLSGYVTCDWRSKELVQVGLQLFGCACIGINLPSAWESNAIWDVTNTRIVGGHDVSPCGYGNKVVGTTADGVVIASWGRLYVITWAAFTSTKWLEEMYFMVPEFLWTGVDGRAPSNVDLATLKADMKTIGGGTAPPLPDPNPPTPEPPPVVPPVPPSPPSPPPPPGPTPITLTGSTTPTVIEVPSSGIFGRKVKVTIPALPVTVSGSIKK